MQKIAIDGSNSKAAGTAGSLPAGGHTTTPRRLH